MVVKNNLLSPIRPCRMRGGTTKKKQEKKKTGYLELMTSKIHGHGQETKINK